MSRGIDPTFRAEVFDWLNRQEAWGNGATTPLPPNPKQNVVEHEIYQKLFAEFLKTRSLEEYDYIHAVRFANTISMFGSYLESAKTIVELGGHSRIGAFASHAFGADYREYTKDLRLPYETESSSVDCILCLEVLEHIKDTSWSEDRIERVALFNYSGMNNLFSESYRTLKPGGILLLTTPNANSVDVIYQVMRGEHPHLFEPHVRELAPRQVKSLAERVGFSSEVFGTFFAWTTASDQQRSTMLKFITDMGFDASNRGDDAAYVFRKPS